MNSFYQFLCIIYINTGSEQANPQVWHLYNIIILNILEFTKLIYIEKPSVQVFGNLENFPEEKWKWKIFSHVFQLFKPGKVVLKNGKCRPTESAFFLTMHCYFYFYFFLKKNPFQWNPLLIGEWKRKIGDWKIEKMVQIKQAPKVFIDQTAPRLNKSLKWLYYFWLSEKVWHHQLGNYKTQSKW